MRKQNTRAGTGGPVSINSSGGGGLYGVGKLRTLQD